MRVPAVKVYRAFPELDRFPDAQCEAYIRSAWKHHALSGGLVSLFAAGVFLIGGGLLFVAANLFFARAGSHSQLSLLISAAFIVLPFLASGLLALLIKDRWLRWAIRDQIKVSRCPSCAYLLLGLTVSDGAITCPECGMRLILKDIGLTPEDLLASALTPSATVPVQPDASPSDRPLQACSPDSASSSPFPTPSATPPRNTNGS